MPRPPLGEKPMSDTERHRKSNQAKKDRGELHIHTWIDPVAAGALKKITNGSTERGAIKAAISEALIRLAKD